MKIWMRLLEAVAVMGVLVAIGGVCGCDSSSGGGGGSSTPGAHFLAGVWSGTWEDTRFSVSGPVNITITQDGDTFTVTGTLGLDPFGLVTQALTGSATIAGDTVTFRADSESIGGITGTVTGVRMSGAGESTGTLGFGPVTYEGSASGSRISVDFAFTRAGAGVGVVTLDKQ
jgi:hypothetical protein